MDDMAVTYMNTMENAPENMIVTEEQKQEFIASLRDLHQHGYYLVINKLKVWKASNKNPDKLKLQMDMFDQLIDSTFTKVEG